MEMIAESRACRSAAWVWRSGLLTRAELAYQALSNGVWVPDIDALCDELADEDPWFFCMHDDAIFRTLFQDLRRMTRHIMSDTRLGP